MKTENEKRKHKTLASLIKTIDFIWIDYNYKKKYCVCNCVCMIAYKSITTGVHSIWNTIYGRKKKHGRYVLIAMGVLFVFLFNFSIELWTCFGLVSPFKMLCLCVFGFRFSVVNFLNVSKIYSNWTVYQMCEWKLFW